MWIPELSAKVGESAKVDFLGLELCNMSGVEIAYQWRPGNGRFSADVLLAIPNAGPPLDWDRAFARIRSPGHASAAAEPHFDPSSMSAADLGRLLVEEGERGRRAAADGNERERHDMRFEATACMDLARAAEVKRKLDALAVVLSRSDAKQAFEDVRGPSLEGKTIDYSGGNLAYAPYFDLYQLLDRAASSEKLSKEARAAARSAAEPVDAFVIASFGMEGLEHEGFEAGKSGVFLVFPAGDEIVEGRGGEKSKLWSRFRWYSPLPRAGKGDPYGSWSFLADGATPGNGIVENWYELLESWFDPDPDGTGGVDGYRW
jgi:clostripain